MLAMERVLSANSWWESPTHSQLNAKRQKTAVIVFPFTVTKGKRQRHNVRHIWIYLFIFQFWHSFDSIASCVQVEALLITRKSNCLKYNFTHFTPTTREKQSTVVSGRNGSRLNLRLQLNELFSNSRRSFVNSNN